MGLLGYLSGFQKASMEGVHTTIVFGESGPSMKWLQMTDMFN